MRASLNGVEKDKMKRIRACGIFFRFDIILLLICCSVNYFTFKIVFSTYARTVCGKLFVVGVQV